MSSLRNKFNNLERVLHCYLSDKPILHAIFSGVLVFLLTSFCNYIIFPLFILFLDAFIQLLSTISMRYKDSIYFAASEGFSEKQSLSLLLMTLGFLSGSIFATLLAGKKEPTANHDYTQGSHKKDQKAKYIKTIALISLLVSIIFIYAQKNSINKITTWSLCSLASLQSAISYQEHVELQSAFYQIENTSDFYEFHRKLNHLAKERKVKLRPFDPL